VTDNEDKLRYFLKKVTAELHETRRQLAAAREPIAVIGMGCRFPGGADTPAALWELLAEGRDVITEPPEDRGWDAPVFNPDGSTEPRLGGFLTGAADFDPAFFGISPREAVVTDPQQRLLLTVAWEALERAGLDPIALRGSRTGVFTGSNGLDYAHLAARTPGAVNYMYTANSASALSGRVSYLLGLEGPALTVDTACSSSLVAIHLAAQALRQGECEVALAGGASVMATPHVFLGMGRQGGLSPDGRCHAFARSAGGTSWGEGVGVLVLERLSDAQRHGHPILAVIRGSAVNQDGASNGFTAPNGPSQQRVIRAALANAGLTAAEVDAVEAHGTATSLGDPIEAEALLATYGQDRTGEPLWLGSIKSNLAHTQAAAGAAGVMKMVLAIQQGLLPRTLHVDAPTPAVDWESGAVELLTEARPWPETGKPRRAGVSSFGVSGTNAHVIVEQAPPPETPEPRPASPGVLAWPISARNAEALRGQARNLLSCVDEDALDVGYSLATTRSGQAHRAVVLGSTPDELRAGLVALDAGSPNPRVITGSARSGHLAFLFTGQGAQRPGMGAELYETHPVFAAAWDAVAQEFDLDLRAVEADQLDQTQFAQPALFALEVALFRLLESWGVRPDYLLGHSIGEIAAAHLAGVLSLSDACTLVAARGRLMQALPAGGAMLAVQASEDEILPLLTGDVVLAAINGPRSVVVSGSADAVAAIEDALRDRKTKRLRVSHAFHSHLMEPMLTEFEQVARGLSYAPPVIPVISNLTGEPAGERLCDPAYWVAQVRDTVRFHDGLRWLAERDVTRFVELGPDGVLAAMAHETLAGNGVCVPVLREGRPEPQTLLAAVSSLHVNGVSLDWHAILAGGRRIDLPTYAFQNERYWVDVAALADGVPGEPASLGLGATGHPILAAVVPNPESDGVVLTGRLSVTSHPWLAGNDVLGKAVLPATGLLELAIRAGDEVGCAAVEEMTILAPLVLPEDTAVQLQVMVGAEEDGRRSVRIHSRSADLPWTLHAEGVLRPVTAPPDEEAGEWPPADAAELDVSDAYAVLAEAGFRYGPECRGLRAVWTRDGEAFAEIAVPDDAPVHSLMDATTHLAMLISLRKDPAAGKVFQPTVFADVALHAVGTRVLRVRMSHPTPEVLTVSAVDENGRPVLSVGRLLGQPLTAAQVVAGGDDVLYRVEWRSIPQPISMEIPDPVAWDDVPANGPVPEVVVLECVTPDGQDGPEAVRSVLYRALDAVRACVADARFATSKLVVVTRNAVAVTHESTVDVVQAPVWGLVRAAQAENPGRFVLLDLDELDELSWFLPPAVTSGEPELAVRALELRVPRMTRADTPAPAATLDPDGTVLITGGTGGLGGLVARRLVTDHGVRHLLLASRRGDQAPGTAELRAELTELGASVTVAACDVGDREALSNLLASVPAEHPLTGVVHAAGVAAPGMLSALPPERWEPVLRAKADSAWHLHELTLGMDLQAFVLFSSAGGLVLTAGHANYAAANVFLDGLAQRRRAEGLAATSIAYGVWAGAGAGQWLTDVQTQRMRRQGLPALSEEDGLRSFDAALYGTDAQLVSLRVDVAALRSRTDWTPPLLRGLVPPARVRLTVDADALTERLAGLSDAADRRQVLADLVADVLAAVLGHESSASIETDRNFGELGVDSLTAAELRNHLADVTGLTLPVTLVFDYPNTEAVAAFLDAELVPAAAAEPDLIDSMATDDLVSMAFAAAGEAND
jgi:acyl transferase domain-containing protein/acyl carrier protein